MIKRLLLISTILFLSTSLTYAQFNIENKVELDTKGIDQLSKLEKEETQFVVLNDAYVENQKKLIRKERNSFSAENSIYFTQYGYNNWASGTTNSFNGRITSYIKHIYNVTNKLDITSLFDAAYAMSLQDSTINKTEDKFNINVAANLSMSDHFYYTLSLDLKSQFSNTIDSDTITSGLFSPATVTLGLGINYKLDSKRTFTLSPISGNMIIMTNDHLSSVGSNGVTPGKHTDLNFGMSAKSDWTQSLIKDKNGVNGGNDILSYRLALQAFWDYQTTPNFTWENWVNLSVYKYFSVSFNATLIFNDKIATPKNSFWQFSEVLGIGVKYTFARD